MSRSSSRTKASAWRFGDLVEHGGEEEDNLSEAEFEVEDGNENSRGIDSAKRTAEQSKRLKADGVERSIEDGELDSEHSDSGISDRSDVYDSNDGDDDDVNHRDRGSSDSGHTGSTSEDDDDEDEEDEKFDVDEIEEELRDLHGSNRGKTGKSKKRRQSSKPSGQQPTARHRHRMRAEDIEEGEEGGDDEDDDNGHAAFDVDNDLNLVVDNDDVDSSEGVPELAVISGDSGRRRVRGAVLVDDTHEATFTSRVQDWRTAQRHARTTQREHAQDQFNSSTSVGSSSSSSSSSSIRLENQDLILSGGNHGGPTVILDPAIAPRLLPYQREGVKWMWSLRARGAGGILADEMGLGKTVQAAAYLLACAQAGELRPNRDGPALVLCPATVSDKGNWKKSEN